MNRVLPLFHLIEGRLVVVVGGGEIAFQKIEKLLAVSARIIVVSPEINEDIRVAYENNQVEWVQEKYSSPQIGGARLVIGATNDHEVNKLISSDAIRKGISVNIVDDPKLCTCYFGSVSHYGPVTIGLSTQGKCPSLSKYLRKKIDQFSLLKNPDSLGAFTTLRDQTPSKQRRHVLSDEIKRKDSEGVFQKPCVSIVGAGVGGIKNLTFAAWDAIMNAEYVFYDALVDPEIVDLISCPRFYVGKRSGRPSTAQESIHQLLLKSVGKYCRVVRLHGGDPMVFGRGGEEAKFLYENGISFRILPGITAFQQAAADGHALLTSRGVSRSIHITTGRVKENEYDHLPRFHAQTTFVLYMSVEKSKDIVARLVENDFPLDLQVTIVERAGRSESRTLHTELSKLTSVIEVEQVESPATILLGRAVHSMIEADGWSEDEHVVEKGVAR